MANSETLAIVGAGGVLGAKLVAQALDARSGDGETPRYPHIYAYTHGTTPAIPAASSPRVTWAPLDIGDPDAVARALDEAKPGSVINAAAMTNVDACEIRRDEAMAVNAGGPRALAQVCKRLGARLLHVSTDYVFDGSDAHPGPYLEDAPTHAISHYGHSKLEGERAIQEVYGSDGDWLIARTALVYGYVPGGRGNFITWLLGELRAGRRVRIVNDQYNTPTLADDLAAALLHLAETHAEGIIHIAGPELLARDAWARAIADHYGLDTSLIDIVSTAELNQRAKRPLRSGLITSRPDDLAGVTLHGVHGGIAALGLE